MTPVFEAAADSILKLSGAKRGYCLVLGSRTGRLACELAKRSELTIYGVDSDPTRVAQSREALAAAGVYGTRVTVDHWPDGPLPYADYFANLIVSEETLTTGELPTSQADITRHLKPCGGVLCLGQPGKAKVTRAALTGCISGDEMGKPKVSTTGGLWATWTRGPLPGAGQWTHQYGDPGNTASSADTALKCPLGVLWYGEPGPDKVPSRHAGNAAPLTINGRVYLQGINRIMCFDAYNGLPYWERELPGAYRVGMVYESSNIVCDDQSIFVAVGQQCLRLSAETGETMQTYEPPPTSGEGNPRWAWIALVGKTLYGSVSRKGQESSLIFALDVAKGKARWTFAGERIRNNTICISEGRLFCADAAVTPGQRTEALQDKIKEIMSSGKISAAEAEKQITSADVRLVTALDAATGKQLWQRPVDLTDCGPHVLIAIATRGVVVFCGAHADGHYWPQFLGGEYGARRATVLSAADGALLWTKAIGYRIRPLVVGDELIAEPWAFDLKTGQQKMRPHPLTGMESPWQFERPGHHCGCISGSPNGLYYRSWSLAYYDLTRDNGTENFGGQRPGCWINMIPANGLLVVPEASSGCICLISIHCTTVFKPRETDKAWGTFSTPGECLPVKQVALNLGAPGDRRADDGTLWLGFPRPWGRMALSLKPTVSYVKGGGVFGAAAETSTFTGTNLPWVYASGCRGMATMTVPLVGPLDGPAEYTVRLGFTETDNPAPGKRAFDIKLQGKTVEQRFDALAAAGKTRAVIVREFKGIRVDDDLKIELAGAAKEPAPEQMPILNSVQIIRERVLHIGMAVPKLSVSDPQPSAEGKVEFSNRTERDFVGTVKLTVPDGLAVTPASFPLKLATNEQATQTVKLTVARKGTPVSGALKVQLVRQDGTVATEREAAVEYLGARGRITFRALADAYVSAGAGTTNYGHSANLLVDGGNSTMGDESHNIGLLRFPLNVPGRIVSVRFRIHTAASEASESNDSGRICVINEPWDENKVTYKDRPKPGAEVGRLGKVGRDAWEERELKVDLAGKTELSLMLDPTSCDGANYVSREGHVPAELVVEYEAAP
ncbi:MAG: PQQ-binding-like beta-propeller repeat protein [Armatimonadetes bacterium]|nr:PQQ-binding-like beta-propeller repeat protein [Armatimonadota bacterium]